MNLSKREKSDSWERTGVNGLLRHPQNRRYYWRTRIDGKQKWEALGTDNFAVAKRRVSERRAVIERQREAMKSVGNGTASMGDLLRVYVTTVEGSSNLAPATRRRYIELANMLPKTWPGFETLLPAKVTKEAIARWRDRATLEGTGYVPPGAKDGSKTKGNAPTTLNKAIDGLRRILSLALDRGMISQNPIAGRGLKLKERPRKPTLPSRLDLQRLFAEVERGAPRGGWGRETADFFRFLSYSGCRLKEAASVKWSDLDMERGILHIRGSKTRASDRYLPLNPPLRAVVDAIRHRREQAAEIAVNGRPSVPPDQEVLGVTEGAKSLSRACLALGLDKLTHHDLRDVFATSCIENGIDIPTIAGWLGHSDGGALLMRVYGHLRNEHSKAMAAKVTF